MITLVPVTGLGEIGQGEDLAAVIGDAVELRDGDVVVISQKIVSKSEGALVWPSPDEDPILARRRVAREQGRRVVAETPHVLIVETRHGLVCANAGVDASNVPGGALALLPADPDASAQSIRSRLATLAGVDVAVLISDTFGRPWRLGQTDVAIGVAGMHPIRDERGGRDRQGRVLDVTEVAVADELAGAADLTRRKGDGVPVVVVRGFTHDRYEGGGARDLVRPPEQDLFARGRGGLVAAVTEHRSWSAPVAGDDLRLALGVLDAAPGAVRAQVRSAPDAPHTAVLLDADTGIVAGIGAGLVAAALADLDYGVRCSADSGGRQAVVEAGR